MSFQQASPMLKVEDSPTESFMSLPGENYTSLFAPTTPSSSSFNPLDVMTPQSFSEDRQTPQLPAISEKTEDKDTPSPGDEDDSSEKKSAKKRKSWGQVLPEPKTNLPPRKRAKTDDEKEQRRVERVLRNRRAAQSSRERKRLEVEALERRNQELEALLENSQKANMMLVEELNRFRHDSGVMTRSSSPLGSLRDAPLTLSQELFSSQDGHTSSNDPAANLVNQLIKSTANPTVNPASLSPELSPVVPDEDELKTDSNSAETQSMSQVSEGAQVITGPADSDVSVLGLDSTAQMDGAFSLGDPFGLPAAFNADRYILESRLLASPNSSTVDDDYLAGDSASGLEGRAEFDLFNIDDFLSDEANNAISDIMAASDYAAADHDLEPKVHDSEIQISQEHLSLQPQSGASLDGCDDGGIAVGV
ncbi:transcription factor that binds to CRE motif [Conoideocrella luteorostrata]|uniref:Transcription factor that binds to CRE motif n=1 Tax=Conoideocrella luteorostrata TaxID=1105319 RepID=A0AAJ0CED8_9HYPO|nr:transcription factor that binds to CRE motif [Conoideocrella luteorostrata]